MKIIAVLMSAMLTLVVSHCFAQSKEKKIEWGEIPLEDIKMKSYPYDSTAAAVILDDFGQLFIYENDERDFEYHLIHHRRIKLLSEKGFKYADVKLPFYKRDGYEKIQLLKAQTISNAGIKTELSTSDFFEEKINENWSAFSFTFPQVQVGAILEYKYEFISKRVVDLRDWYFYDELPIRYSELRLKNETSLVFTMLCSGVDYYKSKKLPGDITQYENHPTKLTLAPGRYYIEHAPALIEEPFITTMDDYKIRIQFQLNEITHSDGFKEKFMTTWEGAAKKLETDPLFGDQYLRERFSKKAVEAIKPLLSKDIDNESKLQFVYQYLNSRLSWNGQYGMLAGQNVDEAWKTGKGSKAELNLLFLGVLRQLGLPAIPIVVSTRSNGLMNLNYPLIGQFNYVMVGIDNGKGLILADLGEPLRPLGLPAMDALNYHGWIADASKSQLINILTPVCRDFYTSVLQVSDNGSISGSCKANYTSYSALQERLNRKEDPSEVFWQNRFGGEGVFLIKNGQIEHELDFQLPLVLKFDFERADNEPAATPDYIYFQPIIYTSYHESPFHNKNRNYPIDFPYPFEEKNVVTVKLPENYEVENLPENINIELPGKGGGFQFTTQAIGPNLQIVGQININASKYAPGVYPDIKAMFDRIAEKFAEPIVLKKKS